MAPEFNPETFETNVPGMFLAGGAICGRDTSNIFIENGRFHGERSSPSRALGERMRRVADGRGRGQRCRTTVEIRSAVGAR